MANEAFKLSYSIKFQLEKRNEKQLSLDGKPIPIIKNLPIQMVITFGGKRLKLFTGYRIDKSKWDEIAQKVKKGASNDKKETWSDINSHLLNLQTTINSSFDDFKLMRQSPLLEDIKQLFSEAQGKKSIENKDTFFNIFELFIQEQGKESTWTMATVKKIRTVFNTLLEFDSNLSFELLDPSKLQSYVEYLRSKKQYRNTTIAKQLKFVRWFLRWAVKKGYSDNISYQDYKPKLTGVANDNDRIIFFTLEELKYLFEFDAGKDYLNRVKDVFLFCCFSGIRFSDVFKLSRSDIKNGYISITTQKTNDALTIQLNKYTASILDKYKNEPFDSDKVLPVISNQKMNKYLKELCKLAGFNEPQKLVYFIGNKRIEEVKPKYELIGTHTARRSFISNAIALGVPVEIVIKWTGHKDYKAMAPYLKIMETKKVAEMSKFDM